MHTAAQLDQLARKLKLTHQQRRFAEALAADPSRNQAAAARAAGSLDKDPAVRGAKWASSDKVLRFVTALAEAATTQAVRRTGRSVATLADGLGKLTELMEHEDARIQVAAAKAVVQHYTAINAPVPVHGHTVNVTLSPGALRELAMAWLQAPGSGRSGEAALALQPASVGVLTSDPPSGVSGRVSRDVNREPRG